MGPDEERVHTWSEVDVPQKVIRIGIDSSVGISVVATLSTPKCNREEALEAVGSCLSVDL